MPLKFAQWVFEPTENLPQEEEELWWQECYVEDPLKNLLENRSQWCAILGEHQNGKTTLLAAIRREWQERALVIDDTYFTGKIEEPLQGNILWRVLYQGAKKMRERITKNPELCSSLSKTQREFLRWATEKFHGARAFPRWLDSLPEETANLMESVHPDDLYPSQEKEAGAQIDELVNAAKKLQYENILVLVDTLPFFTSAHKIEIEKVLGWLESMQHDGLKVIVALPPTYSPKDVRERSRSRIIPFSIEKKPEQLREILNRRIELATEKKIKTLEHLCSPKLEQLISTFLREEFDSHPVGAWLNVTTILLAMAASDEKTPISEKNFPYIKSQFFTQFMPLRLGEDDSSELGIWRGYKWIPLERAIYELAAALIKHHSHRVSEKIVGGSKENLNTLARRLRIAVEPNPPEWIYVKNARGEGYWLEHFSH